MNRPKRWVDFVRKLADLKSYDRMLWAQERLDKAPKTPDGLRDDSAVADVWEQLEQAALAVSDAEDR